MMKDIKTDDVMWIEAATFVTVWVWSELTSSIHIHFVYAVWTLFGGLSYYLKPWASSTMKLFLALDFNVICQLEFNSIQI